MKATRIFVLFLSLIFVVQAQNGQTDKYLGEKKNEENYGCKFDTSGGHIDLVEEGNIIQIWNSNTVIFKDKRGREWTVELLAVNSDSNQAIAKEFLEKNTLNKNVKLIYSSSQSSSRNVVGAVEVKEKDINRLMLELGVAEYKDDYSIPDTYLISQFNDCVYFRAEAKAKSEKLGIWAK